MILCPVCRSANTKFLRLHRDDFGKFTIMRYACLDCPRQPATGVSMNPTKQGPPLMVGTSWCERRAT